MVKLIFRSILLQLFKFLSFISSHLRNGWEIKVLKIALEAFETDIDYLSLYIRPKDTNSISRIVDLNTVESYAIILQGPICMTDNMTVNSIKYYKKIYSHACVIVSTWADENEKILEEIKALGATIVLNKRPSNSGILNINFQLVNSLSGVKKAKDLGYKYAVKTRTDQRICKPYIFDTMLTALKDVYLSNSSKQNNRIVLLSGEYGNMFTPYFMSDFMYFGNVDDMIKLFSAPLDTRKEITMSDQASRYEYAKTMYPPEIYILKHYLENYLNYKCEDTIYSYWKSVKDYFICFSIKEADILWRKYETKYELNLFYGEYFRNLDSAKSMATMSFDFMNWFNLYNGVLEYKPEYEKLVNAPMFLRKDEK